MKIRKSMFLACISIGLAGTVCAQSKNDDPLSAKVDEAVTAQMREQKIPGVSLGVMRDGKIIKATGYGFANVELNVPVTPQSIFQTGSVGKQFTATAVMMLVEEGKVGVDDKITKYFPEAPADWKDVTVRHLLTHTSGIPDYGGDADLQYKDLLNLRQDYTEEELVRKFADPAVEF